MNLITINARELHEFVENQDFTIRFPNLKSKIVEVVINRVVKAS